MKKCPTSRKQKYRTKADALVAALRRSGAEHGARQGGAYHCPDCGFWHLTRNPR